MTMSCIRATKRQGQQHKADHNISLVLDIPISDGSMFSWERSALSSTTLEFWSFFCALLAVTVNARHVWPNAFIDPWPNAASWNETKNTCVLISNGSWCSPRFLNLELVVRYFYTHTHHTFANRMDICILYELKEIGIIERHIFFLPLKGCRGRHLSGSLEHCSSLHSPWRLPKLNV